MIYGQVVLGPPGSGKSTYCSAIQQYYNSIERKVIIINLDPANENILYKCDINIKELITLDDVMEEFALGPNGSLLYCMDFLLKNMDWLYKRLDEYKNCYVVFDFPGQVELFTSNDNVRLIMSSMENHGIRLVALNLVDSFYCSNPEVFISAGLSSLITMVNLELPSINILSKIDLISKYGKTVYDLEYYTELPEMTRMLYCVDQHEKKTESDCVGDSIDEEAGGAGEGFDEEDFVRSTRDPFKQKYRKLYWMLCDVIDDYGLLSYIPLDIQSITSLTKISDLADKANGYSLYSSIEGENKEIGVLNSYSKYDSTLEGMIDDMNDQYVENNDSF